MHEALAVFHCTTRQESCKRFYRSISLPGGSRAACGTPSCLHVSNAGGQRPCSRLPEPGWLSGWLLYGRCSLAHAQSIESLRNPCKSMLVHAVRRARHREHCKAMETLEVHFASFAFYLSEQLNSLGCLQLLFASAFRGFSL